MAWEARSGLKLFDFRVVDYAPSKAKWPGKPVRV